MPGEHPITNCHTHIFTADHVPPLLGRSLIPWPFYYIANINCLIAIVRSVKDKKGALRIIYFSIKRPVDRIVFWWQRHTEHNLFKKILSWLFQFIVAFACTLFILSFLRRFFTDQKGIVRRFLDFVFSNPFLVNINKIDWGWKLVILVLGMIFFKSVRNLAKTLLFVAFSFLKSMMGSASLQLLKRYYNIAVLCEYKRQEDIYKVLANSYPDKTKFVVLPMDLDYTGAGKPKQPYMQQLDQLIALKSVPELSPYLQPFVFADPRRFTVDPNYYAKVINCLENGFVGIKIYPALGYYPFDENLLKLYFYACAKGIPITTHCIRGVIFYRGFKKKEWDYHPVFTETADNAPLQLKQFKNVDFINNFTHPLNYLCLLDPLFLKIVLHQLAPGAILTKELYQLYGFTKADTPDLSILEHDLRKLKLCFGHFGGEDEWAKYIERDMSQMENKFVKNPRHADNFSNPLKQQWEGESWYSIIRSIIMNDEYPNVYADISFIIYDPNIISLLKSSLAVPRLQDRILYGTDFYVVRQNGNDKKFWLDIQAHLTPAEMKLIAVDNPAGFIGGN